MYCIVEILVNGPDAEQGLGRTYGPISELENAKEAASNLANFSLNDHPNCQVYEMDKDDLEGDDFAMHGFSIETQDNDVMALYLVKELFTVATPIEA